MRRRATKRLHRPPVAMFALALAACAPEKPSMMTCPAPEGAEVVTSSGPGVWEERGVEGHLVELWRRGGLREGEALGFPIHIAAAPSGFIAIPDFMLAEVPVITPDGRWLGNWTPQGEGPGEVQHPVAAGWDGEGVLSIYDIIGASVVFLRGGEAAREELPVDPMFGGAIVNAGEFRGAGVLPAGDVLLEPSFRTVAEEGSAPLIEGLVLRLRPGEEVPDTVLRVRSPALGSDPPFSGTVVPGEPRPLLSVGAGGSFALGSADGSYRIEVHGPDGLVCVICRDAAPLPLTDAERGEGEFPEDRSDVAARIREVTPRARPAAYGDLVLGAQGRLWVQRDRPDPATPLSTIWGQPGARFDVFDAAGRYLGELTAPPRARLRAASGDTVWAFETGELDETWIVAYRLELAAPESAP